MTKRRNGPIAPRKRTQRLVDPFIQRLSDYSTVKLKAKVVDDLQAPTVFNEDIAGGDGAIHDATPAYMPTHSFVDKPEYRRVAPIVSKSAKAEQIRQTVNRQKSLDIAMKLIESGETNPVPHPAPVLKHNQQMLGDSVATVKSVDPKSWRRL